jgi:hypothetical protein
VIEGVVIQRDPITGEPQSTNARIKHARMQVDQVWKGEAAAFVTLEFGEDTAACELVPPIGEHIRISVIPISPNVFSYDVTSGDGPGDASEDAGLKLYRERTLAEQHKAETGGPAEKRAFADYLRRNGEVHRALWMYEALLRQTPGDLDSLLGLAVLQGTDEAQATLSRLRELAPKTDEWRGKLARTTFLATGVLSSSWKDWSNIENARHCTVDGSDFDSANFDGARLNTCLFPANAHFHGASFRGSDLRSSDFLVWADVKGAFYDCATRLPEWVDMAATGMINVEGKCAEAAPQ